MFGPKIFKPFSEDTSYSGRVQKDEHEWEEVKLLNFKVKDCKKCGCKKEVFDKNPDIPCEKKVA